MGGKALRIYGVETERKETSEFLNIAKFFQEKVENDLGVETHVTQFFKEKDTHGDLDLLIKIDNPINIKEYIINNFETKAIHNNGGVVSFEFNNFQIDFIPIKSSNWEVSKVYFDFDPSGNLIGKTAHKFGVKYGSDGLTLPVRGFSGKINKNISLSKDNRKVFEFLGYDYDRYIQGFDTKEDIFDWVINSKYFDAIMFQMKNLNQVDRKRNKKRVTYQEFLKYLETHNINKIFSFKTKEEYLKEINDCFPDVRLKEKLEDFNKKNEISKEIAKKFNGHIIMKNFEWLKGKELGEKMLNFKNLFENFNEYILNNTVEKIIHDFDNFLKINN